MEIKNASMTIFAQYRSLLKIELVMAVAALFMVAGCQKQESHQVRASDLVRKYLRVNNAKELTDENIREGLFKIVPPGSSVSEIFERMANIGLGAGHCAPGEDDGSPFANMPYCGIRSSEGSCGKEYANYNFYFVIDKSPNIRNLFEAGATKLRDIKIDRWIRECR